MNYNDPIAIVGIGCRFPGNANGPKEFWKMLLNKQDGVITVPKDRWRGEIYADRDGNKAGKSLTDKGGFIENIDKFDAEFFNVPPNQAETLDPQQRILLETTYEAFEDAGITLDDISGTRTSVIVGSFIHDYLMIQNATEMTDNISPHTLLGTHISMIANRISHFYNLNGPSYTIDTACSSSLAAVHLATQSILNDNCETAIAAGVNIMLRPEIFISLSKGGFLSKDGRCKTFDATADGYVRGEGVGVILLKQLSKALRDGNKIYTIIKNSGVNQNGFNRDGIAIPSKTAQINLMKHVYDAISFDPNNITYIEAHGTGTIVGDPIEVSALGEVIGACRKENNNICYVGSVKTNIGHTEGTAGIASLTKAALISKHRKIPANLHLNAINPKLHFDKYCFKVPMETINLSDYEKRIYVAVNSFGAGGTNSHVLLEEYIVNEVRQRNRDVRYSKNLLPFIITAKSKRSLECLSRSYYEFVSESSENAISDICYNLLRKRTMFSHQLIIFATSKEQLLQNLSDFNAKNQNQQILYRKENSKAINKSDNGKLAFVFSGQGSHWLHMGKELVEDFPIFRETLTNIDEFLKPLSGWSIIDELLKQEKDPDMNDVTVVQVLTMSIQIGLIKLWNCFGIHPDGVVGHSLGEMIAQFAAGAITIEEAAYTIWRRSCLSASLKGKGKMLAIALNEEETKEIADKYQVCIAALNGPKLSVLSGEEHVLKKIAAVLDDSKTFNRFVKSDVPYHSKCMESIKDDFLQVFKDIKGKKTKIALYSTVTAKKQDGEHITAEYLYKNLRQTVLFTETINVMIADGFTKFIEIAPHPLLISGIKELLNKHNVDGETYHSTLRNRSESCELILNIGKYMASKGVYNTHSFFMINNTGLSDVELPHYVWQHDTSYWHEPKDVMEQRIGKYVHPFLSKRVDIISTSGGVIWETNLNTNKFPYLCDHIIDETIVFPAAAYIEFIYAIAKEHIAINQQQQQQIILKNITFERALIIPDSNEDLVQLRFETISSNGDFNIYAKKVNNKNYDDNHRIWTKHAGGVLIYLENAYESKTIDLVQLQEEFTSVNLMKNKSIYEKLKKNGLNYGKRFQGINKIWHKDRRILAEILLPDDIEYEIPFYYMHPALLDICLHCVYSETVRNGDDQIYLPHTIKEVVIIKKAIKNKFWSYIEVMEHSKYFLIFDAYIFDESGTIITEVKNLVSKNLSPKEVNYNYEYKWIEQINNAMPITKHDIHECIIFYGSGVENFVERLAEIAKLVSDVEMKRFNINEYKESYKLTQLLSTFVLDKRTHLIYLPSNKFYSSSLMNYCETIENETILFLELIKIIIKLNRTPRMYIIGDNAINFDTKLGDEVNYSLLTGIGRVLRNEHPEIPLKMIQLSEISSPSLSRSSSSTSSTSLENSTTRVYDNSLIAVYNELLKWNFNVPEVEVKLEKDKRYIRKLYSIETYNFTETFVLNPKKSYIITGGTSGLGLKLVKWLCDHGALHIILISRSGFKSKLDQEFIEKIINSYAVNIHVEKIDITEIESVKNLFSNFGKSFPPLAGIIHSAGVLQSSTIENTSADQIHDVIPVKMRGALILHMLSLNISLDFFLMISSISATIGKEGTVAYAAANYSLDTIAQLRRSLNLPGTSLNLGVLGEYAGMSREVFGRVGELDAFEIEGYLTIPLYQVLDGIDRVLSKQAVNEVIANLDWDIIQKWHPHLKIDARFTKIINEKMVSALKQQQSSDDIFQKLSLPDYDKQIIVSDILSVLRSIFCQILAISLENLDNEQSIATLGLDSIYLMQIRSQILRKLNITYPVMKLLRGPSLNELSEDLFNEILVVTSPNDILQNEQHKLRDFDFIIVNEWLIAEKRNENAKFKLICFHSMGSNASLFTNFLRSSPENVEMLAVQLPGRENRAEEARMEDFSALVKVLAENLYSCLADKPFIFWGHSFGGLIAFQLLSYLQREYNLKPQHFIISGSIAPDIANIWKTREIVTLNVNENNLEAILSSMSIYDPIIVKQLLPGMTLDIPLLSSYHDYSNDYNITKLPCGITAFAAKQDDVVYPSEVEHWKLFTDKSFECILVDGDHWFLNKNYALIQAKLNELATNEFN